MASSGQPHNSHVRENLSLVLSGAALLVAIAGTAVSCHEARSAADEARSSADQARSSRQQADIARRVLKNESTAQALRVNLNPDRFRRVLVLQNTSQLPIRGIRVYLAEDGEPAVQFASRDELTGCALIRLEVRDTDPHSLVAVFTDARGVQWITDGESRMEKTDLSPLDLPEARQKWAFRVRPLTSCS